MPVLVHGSPVLLNLTPKQNPWSHPQPLHCSRTNAICQQTHTEPSEHSQDLITLTISLAAPRVSARATRAGISTLASTLASQTTNLSPTPHSSIRSCQPSLLETFQRPKIFLREDQVCLMGHRGRQDTASSPVFLTLSPLPLLCSIYTSFLVAP